MLSVPAVTLESVESEICTEPLPPPSPTVELAVGTTLTVPVAPALMVPVRAKPVMFLRLMVWPSAVETVPVPATAMLVVAERSICPVAVTLEASVRAPTPEVRLMAPPVMSAPTEEPTAPRVLLTVTEPDPAVMAFSKLMFLPAPALVMLTLPLFELMLLMST